MNTVLLINFSGPKHLKLNLVKKKSYMKHNIWLQKNSYDITN